MQIQNQFLNFFYISHKLRGNISFCQKSVGVHFSLRNQKNVMTK